MRDENGKWKINHSLCKEVAKLVLWSDKIPEYCRLKKAQQK